MSENSLEISQQIVTTKRPVAFELANEPLLTEVTDKLSDQDTVNNVLELSKQFVEQIDDPDFKVDGVGVKKVADLMNETFSFIMQGSGAGTLPDLLNYFKINRDNKDLVKKGLDCKMPTVMTAYVLQELASLHDQKVNLQFRSKSPDDVHPYLQIDVFNTKETYLVDFTNLVPQSKDSGITFKTPMEEVQWERQNSTSKANVRLLDETGKDRLSKTYTEVYPLNVGSLRHFDQVYVES